MADYWITLAIPCDSLGEAEKEAEGIADAAEAAIIKVEPCPQLAAMQVRQIGKTEAERNDEHAACASVGHCWMTVRQQAVEGPCPAFPPPHRCFRHSTPDLMCAHCTAYANAYAS